MSNPKAKPKHANGRRKPEIHTNYPQRAAQHAAKLEQDFAAVYDHIARSQNHHDKLPPAIKKKVNMAVGNVVASGLSKGVCPSFSSEKDKTTFQGMILNQICDLFSCTVPQEMFDALGQSFKHLVPKIQALDLASQHHNHYPARSPVGTREFQDADTILSTQVARLSVDHEMADNTDDESIDDEKETSKQMVQPAITLQGIVGFIPGQSDLESGEGSGEDCEINIKEESEDKAVALVPPDPTVFTITLGVPIAVDDHRFSIRFNNERVLDGLSRIPYRGIWQLIHDAVQHDPDIPNRSSSIPRITEVLQQDDKCLAFRTKTREDLQTITTNVQWARDIRDTASNGIKTYKVIFEYVKIRTMKTESFSDRALIIDKLREENAEKIPSLNQLGAIRDVMMLQEPASKMERDDYADYILVFGSRDAANAALKLGLTFRKKSRGCVVYEPATQWHQQCSHCQGHSHTAKDCQSSPFCGKCGYKHATQYCTSATFECANCHGAHMASSKKCPEWLKAEDKAHRSYRFPAEDSEAQAPTPAKAATATSLPLPMSPLPGGQKPQETRNTKPEIAIQLPKSSQAAITIAPASLKPKNNAMSNEESQPATTNPPAPLHPSSSSSNIPIDNQTHPSTPSALLQTIDEFRAFVAARENSKQSSKKRKEREYVIAGALQDHDGKRVKREDEGPVWPIGQRDYRPPSLRVRRLEG